MENRYLISGIQLGNAKTLILKTITIVEKIEPIIDRKKAIENLKRLDGWFTNIMEKQYVGLRKESINKDVKALKMAYEKV